MATALQQGYIVDGKFFATAAEARDFQRAPLVKKAMLLVTGNNADFAGFLIENQEEIEKAFDSGVIARVTKAERKLIAKAFDEIKSLQNGKLKFLQDNAAAFIDSFKWPAVARLKDEEKADAAMTALTKLSDEKTAKWIYDSRASLEAAYSAGVEKRSAPAGSGLADYLAAKKAGPEALAVYQAKKAAEKAAKATA